jgi:hypothetical protein
VHFLDLQGNKLEFVKTGQPLRIRIAYDAHKEIENPVFGVALYSDTGVHITGPNTRKHNFPIAAIKGQGYVEYEMESVPLLPGSYLFSAAIYDYQGLQAYDHWEQHWKLHVLETPEIPERLGLITIPARWRLGK